jgi:hypothetical protein
MNQTPTAVGAPNSGAVHASIERNCAGQSLVVCGRLAPHRAYAREAEINCPACLRQLSAGPEVASADRVASVEPAPPGAGVSASTEPTRATASGPTSGGHAASAAVAGSAAAVEPVDPRACPIPDCPGRLVGGGALWRCNVEGCGWVQGAADRRPVDLADIDDAIPSAVVPAVADYLLDAARIPYLLEEVRQLVAERHDQMAQLPPVTREGAAVRPVSEHTHAALCDRSGCEDWSVEARTPAGAGNLADSHQQHVHGTPAGSHPALRAAIDAIATGKPQLVAIQDEGLGAVQLGPDDARELVLRIAREGRKAGIAPVFEAAATIPRVCPHCRGDVRRLDCPACHGALQVVTCWECEGSKISTSVENTDGDIVDVSCTTCRGFGFQPAPRVLAAVEEVDAIQATMPEGPGVFSCPCQVYGGRMDGCPEHGARA